MPKKLLLVDDHPLVLSGLQTALRDAGDIVVDAAVRTRTEAARVLRSKSPPDLALFDIGLADGSIFLLIDELQREGCNLCFAMLTASRDWEHLQRARALGARGYLLKDEEPDLLLAGIRSMLAGEYRFPGGDRSLNAPIPDELLRKFHTLSDREKEVLRLIGRGFMNREIAAHLNLSIRTVESHRARLSEKLEARTTIQLSSIMLELRTLLGD